MKKFFSHTALGRGDCAGHGADALRAVITKLRNKQKPPLYGRGFFVESLA